MGSLSLVMRRVQIRSRMNRQLVRAIVLTAAAFACLPLRSGAAAALPALASAARTPYVAILDWHDVTVPDREVWFDTPVAEFRSQMARIASGGFHVVTLEAMVNHLQQGTPLPPKAIALTFDDNGTGIYTNAFPILEHYHFPATLFVHTAFVGVTTSKHHNTWAQLEAMHRSGLISIQSLTVTHPPDLRVLPDAQIHTQLLNSRASIEKRIGNRVFAFVYPEDNYDDRVARDVAAAGYTAAFIEDWGNAGESQNLMMIHRYSILKRFDQALADVSAGRATAN